ncbi:MAG: hypothetical protein HYY67_06540 [Thaumarchaeota archaeon]|nr:hypothetical protein [Nitrososphaerota archaeon]
MDSIGGMMIAGYIYTVAYASLKQSKRAVSVQDVKMRRAGPYIVGIVSIAADGNLTQPIKTTGNRNTV